VNNGIGAHWILSARHAASEFEAISKHLDLDIISTGEPGVFRVMMEGKALTDAKIRLTNQSDWSMQPVSDQDGIVRFPAQPWEG